MPQESLNVSHGSTSSAADSLTVRGGVVAPAAAAAPPATGDVAGSKTKSPPAASVALQHLEADVALEKIRSLLTDFRTAMLTTVSDGTVRSRPMGLIGKAADFNGTLWFFTDDRNDVLQEIVGGAAAALIFQSDKESAYLQLGGRATQVRDTAKMRELYSPLLKTWFPDGLEDPHLTLIRFDAETGGFWDSPGGFLRLLGAFAKAVITHEPAAGGEHGTMTL